MLDLIGRPYRLHGGDGTIDCIQLVYEVERRLGIPTPDFDENWYQSSRFTITRALLRWGTRVNSPDYDGDVVLLRQPDFAFAVVWQDGLFHIDTMAKRVNWCPIRRIPSAHVFRYCPMNGT